MGGQILADQSSSFQAMRDRVTQVVRIVMEDPAVESVNAYVGGGNGYSKAFMQISLKPLEERGISSDEVIARLRPKLEPIPGTTVYLAVVPGSAHRRPRQRRAVSVHPAERQRTHDLNYWAPLVYERLKKLPELVDVNTDQQDKGLEDIAARSTAPPRRASGFRRR